MLHLLSSPFPLFPPTSTATVASVPVNGYSLLPASKIPPSWQDTKIRPQDIMEYGSFFTLIFRRHIRDDRGDQLGDADSQRRREHSGRRPLRDRLALLDA